MSYRLAHLLAVAAGLSVLACGGAQTERPDDPGPLPASQAPARPTTDTTPGIETPKIVARNFDVAPGKFAEVNFEADEGVEVTAAFRSDGDVQWNVHSHPQGGVAVHQEGVGKEGAISFVAAAGGNYSYLWTNAGEQSVNLIVSVEIPAGARILSWVPEVEQ